MHLNDKGLQWVGGFARVTRSVLTLIALVLIAMIGEVAALKTSPQVALAEPLSQAAGQGVDQVAGRRLLYTVRGTPHLWLADEQGVLHWVGDSTALARALYPAGEYVLQDPLVPTLRHTLETPVMITYEQLLASPRGAPLLSTTFVTLDGAIYYPQWEPFHSEPVLLRVPSAADLATFSGSHDPAVLSREEWEQRYGVSLEKVKREVLRSAAPPQPSPLPCLPVVLSITPQTNGAVAEVQNPCDSVLQARLSAVLYDAPEGQPLQTTRSTRVEIATAETHTVQLSTQPPAPTRPDSPDSGAEPPAPPAREGIPQPAIIEPGWARPLLSAAPVQPLTPEEEERLARLRETIGRTGGGIEILEKLESSVLLGERQPPEPLCLDVQAAACLLTDPWLRQAVEVLQQNDKGRQLLALAADFGVTIRRANLYGNNGQYESRSRTVTLSSSMDVESDWERAAVLAHELQHAVDDATGEMQRRGATDCLARERGAFRTGGEVWTWLWQGNLPSPRSQFQERLNSLVGAAESDPSTYDREIARLYLHHCYL